MPGSWTVGPRTVTWAVPPVIGDGSNDQGGDPPALAYEPAAIDENGLYTRSEWLGGTPSRSDQGEAKFRITCNHAFFAPVDPLISPGEIHDEASHSHTFIGNIGLYENEGLAGLASADYASLRNNPKSTCSGGPLNATLYWEPTLFYEHPSGIDRAVKPNIVSFYYTLSYANVEEMYRLLRGLTFIGGVDPTDRLNTARLAEIPNGQGWDKTRRYNGWVGWAAYNGATIIPLAVGNTADASAQSVNFARQLVNADGSDPWGGAAEDPDVLLIANMVAPSAWDGHNLRSPNGRDHFRYPIRKSDNSYTDVGPQGWWKVPHFEVKTEFANGHVDGLSGHAYRSKLYLSSDRFGREEVDWHPRGSTFHFDWMNGWDSEIQHTWQDNCTGTTQDGVAGHPLTCNDSTISATQKMKVLDASPDPTLSNDPIITLHDYSTGATKDIYDAIPSGTVVPGGTVS